MRYIQSFNTSGDVKTALDNGLLGNPYVAYVEADGTIDWNTKEKTDYSKMPLTFEIISGGTITWISNYEPFLKEISYQINDGEWISITATTAGTSFNVSDGDIVRFKGDGSNAYDISKSNRFSTTATFEVYGNLMSLIDSTGYTTLTSLSGYGNAFTGLFNDCKGLTSAKDLILSPTTLNDGCYNGMFYNCKSLTTAPVLPALTLKPSCYANMFNGCSKLNYIKCLATNISAVVSRYNWVSGVASSGTFVKNTDMNDWPTGNSGIPNGWTVIDAE